MAICQSFVVPFKFLKNFLYNLICKYFMKHSSGHNLYCYSTLTYALITVVQILSLFCYDEQFHKGFTPQRSTQLELLVLHKEVD